MKILLFTLTLAFAGAHASAQTPGAISIQVKEAGGIRRTTFPTSFQVTLSRGAVSDLSHVRLREGETDVPAQFAINSKWPDGSIERLGIDVNVTIGPLETRTFQLQYGASVTAGAAPRGLSVTEEADAIQVGSLRFSKSGTPPLVLSGVYRDEERLGTGANGLAITDRNGARHDLATAQGIKVEILKRGPLNVAVQYSGRLPLDASSSVPFVVTFEVPSSKAWFKMSATVDDPSRQVTAVAFETPYGFKEFPWPWDVGTDNGTYGALTAATESMRFTQTVTAGTSGDWRVEAGPEGKPQVVERSLAGRSSIASGWAHFQDARHVVAVAIEGFGKQPGAYTVSMNGRGQASFGFAPAQPATEHKLTVYEHFVLVPVQIGAATSPASILSPLVVEIGR